MAIDVFDMRLDNVAELNAINDILSAIGEPPINTSEEMLNSDVANARRILDRINRMVQSQGWTFNIETNTELLPDIFSQQIPYLQTYLRVLSPSGQTTYINRNGFMWDTSAKTDLFTASITVDIVVLRFLDELPEVFRQYIIAESALQYNVRFFGPPEITQQLQNEKQDLYRMCMEFELDYGNFNMLTGDSYVSSQLGR